MYKPEIKKEIDWSEVIRQAKEHIDSIESGEYHEDSDDIHYLYEAVIEAAYGKEIWKWMNEKIS